jgi:hypothetical protein
MTDLSDAARQALKSLRGYRREIGCDQPCDAERALEAALAESANSTKPVAESEPVAWMVYTQDGKSVCVTDNPADFIEWRSFPLYTHPPRREWRGLKEWEINDGLDQLPTEDVCSWSFRKGVYFAEAELKELNHE